jgi:ubiquinone/menaquinone biosynthesis C-methylase UbiE
LSAANRSSGSGRLGPIRTTHPQVEKFSSVEAAENTIICRNLTALRSRDYTERPIHHQPAPGPPAQLVLRPISSSAGSTMTATDIPAWQLPAGVTRGLWDYTQADHIATDYDDYFAQNSLFEFDEAVLRRHFRRPGRLVDLGCGTGRLLMGFVRDGFGGLAVDLSHHMLSVVGEKARQEDLPIDRLLANMVAMDCLRDNSVDYCMCMFSTLGMIRGRENRRQVLGHVRRILKPDGLFALHVHNRWYNLFDPQSRIWLVRNLMLSPFQRDTEPGDKFFDYRGIANMFLHVFTKHELLADLATCGFRVRELVPLDRRRHQPLPHAWLGGRLRANGWIAVCELA